MYPLFRYTCVSVYDLPTPAFGSLRLSVSLRPSLSCFRSDQGDLLRVRTTVTLMSEDRRSWDSLSFDYVTLLVPGPTPSSKPLCLGSLNMVYLSKRGLVDNPLGSVLISEGRDQCIFGLTKEIFRSLIPRVVSDSRGSSTV